MANEPTITWTGKSGNKYTYTIYPIDTNFNAVAGNYVFMKRYIKDNQYYYTALYFGITDNMKERHYDHEKMPCVKNNGGTHIGFHFNSKDNDRDKEETDLLANYNTVCNIQKN